MKRRDFLKLSAFLAASSLALTSCVNTSIPIEAPVQMPEDHPVDSELLYASACGFCGGGCGIVVRNVAGRARKIEGNPEHPVNRGTLCARGQAGLQLLYNIDRIQGPLRRLGDKGTGVFNKVDWNLALQEAANNLGTAAGRGAGSVLFLSGRGDGQTALLADKFAKALGGPGLVYLPPFGEASAVVRQANRAVYGIDGPVYYDLADADYVLSFGADLFGSGSASVLYDRAYGAMRQGRPGRRGRLVQIEPRMSLTGANADRWLSPNPGTEGALALGIANAILAANPQINVGGLTAADISAWKGALQNYSPDNVARITGLPASQISQLAQDFANARPGLAVAGGPALGHSNGLSTQVAVNILNLLAGNVGQPGGVRPAPQLGLSDQLQAVPPSFRDLQTVFDNMRSGKVAALLLYEANPAYTLPFLNASEALGKVPFILSFNNFVDDSTAYADLVLPDHTYLESWDTRVPTLSADQAVLTVQQPAVNPMYDTRGTADVILALAKAIGGAAAQALPWGTINDVLNNVADQIQKANRGSVKGGSAAEVWQMVVQHGGWWDNPPAPTPLAPDRQATVSALRFDAPRFEGDATAYPMLLQVYESPVFGEWRGASVPWLQELPDQMTTAIWCSWAELNPQTAAQMGLQQGDPVTVATPRGQVSVPVFLNPGLRPDVVAMPTGQGHANYTRYAAKRGVNPLTLLAPSVEAGAGGFAYAATRAKVSRSSAAERLIEFEGNSSRLPGRAFFE